MFLFAPNSTLWNAPLKNHTRNQGRIVSLNVAVPAAADSDRARDRLDQLRIFQNAKLLNEAIAVTSRTEPEVSAQHRAPIAQFPFEVEAQRISARMALAASSAFGASVIGRPTTK